MATKEKKKTGADFKLNLNQAKFAEYYSLSDEYFANGVQAYLKAYGNSTEGGKKVSYLSAMASSSQLLRNPKVLDYVNYLLELKGLNDSFVDKQLELVITQNGDLKTKLGGIKEYNVLKQRITKNVDLTSKGEKIEGIKYVKPE